MSSSTTTVIEFNRVTKYNGTDRILNNVSIGFQKEKIYGIAANWEEGPKILFYGILGKMRMDWGNIVVCGQRVGVDIEQPECVTVMLDRAEFVPSMSPFQNLKALSFMGKKISDEQILMSMKRVGLSSEDNRWLGSYSNQDWLRLQFAKTIMGGEPILLLREPFMNLEVKTRRDMKAMLRRYTREGNTVLLTSQTIEDMKYFCDICYCFDKGRLKAV